MCTVSMIADHYLDRWGQRRPWLDRTDIYYPGWENPYPWTYPPEPLPDNSQDVIQKFINDQTKKAHEEKAKVTPKPLITAEEIAEFRALLDRAREYDKRNNEPACENADKKARLIALAKELGAELTFPEGEAL